MHVKDIEVEINESMRDVEDWLDGYRELTEADLYPPEDPRVYASGIDDVDGGDTFAEYAEYFWETYGHEIYDEINF